MLLKLQAKENGFNENNEEEILCPIANCDWSEKVNRRSSFIKHLGIFHKVLDVCYEECKEQPPPPKVNSPEPPKKKMSLSDYKKKRQTDDTQQAETGNGIKQEVKMEVETEAERKGPERKEKSGMERKGKEENGKELERKGKGGRSDGRME